jgi:dTDP-4-dehydrorhamnose 3,5-epimerase
MFEKTPLPGLMVVTTQRIEDARGWFAKPWSRELWEKEGLHFDWCDDNHSYSMQAGTIRGLHFQAPPFAQTKLVRCSAGKVRDVAVDVRKGSPTYGQWYSIDLAANDVHQILVPRGFLHGIATLEPHSEIQYKVDAPYSPAHDGAVRFDDPAIGVDWGIDTSRAILSAKDTAAQAFHDFDSPFEYESGG